MAFGFFDRIKDGLEKTRKSFVKNVESIVIGYAQIDDDFLDDLEAVMLTSDLGPKTTEYLMKEIRRGVTEGVINNTGDVMPFMEDRITEMLVDQEDEITLHHPEVILVVGVNGVGKTTTIAKLANYYTKEGKKVIIAAGDTFRAAAADQLSIWADRVGVPIVKHKEQESGIKGIARATKYYDFDGNLETDLKAMNVNVKHEGAFEYGDPFYTAAHYAFDRAYHVFF